MTTASDPALLDTNILVYAYYQQAPQHADCRALLNQAQDAAAGLCVAPQNLIEFYAVVTSSKRVSSAMSPAEAVTALGEILALPGVTLLTVPVDVVQRVAQLIGQHAVAGRQIFDVQLVATMLGNNVTKIYTFNVADFAPFASLQVLTP